MEKRPDELHKTPIGLLDSVLSVRYMYLCFKIGRKMRIFSLGRKNTILVKKECTYEVLTKEFPPTGIGVF